MNFNGIVNLKATSRGNQMFFANYFRHLMFAAGIAALQYHHQQTAAEPINVLHLWVIYGNTVMYPFARSAYEKFIRFIIGPNIFVLPLIIMLPYKMASMFGCWLIALVLGPVGMIFGWLEACQEKAIRDRGEPTPWASHNDDWN